MQKISELEEDFEKQKDQYDIKLKEIEDNYKTGKNKGIFQAMMEDEEDSLDIEKNDQAIQTDASV